MVYFLVLLWAASTGTACLGALCGYRRTKKSPSAEKYPISILKPLKGRDANLEENLRSFFGIDYPAFEILFSVADKKDPAVPVVQKIISENPHVPAELLICRFEAGPNPKVNNLILSYQKAKYDWILVSDSNIRVDSNYLSKLVENVKPDTGVVTSAIVGEGQHGLGGNLEAIYLNTFYVKWMRIATLFGLPVVVGKSMLFRRTVAERFGGIKNLARYLAEDYMTGRAMLHLGLKTVLAELPVHQQIGDHNFRDFWARHIRWGRIRKAHAPFAFLIEPFMGAMLSGFAGAWGFYRLLGIHPLAFLLLHFGLWFLFDAIQMRQLKVRVLFSTFGVWVVRELISLPHWIHIALGNEVAWRGNRLRIQMGGLIE